MLDFLYYSAPYTTINKPTHQWLAEAFMAGLEQTESLGPMDERLVRLNDHPFAQRQINKSVPQGQPAPTALADADFIAKLYSGSKGLPKRPGQRV